MPPINEIKRQLPMITKPKKYIITAMPIEQKLLAAAQQAGQLGTVQSDPTSFYLLDTL